MTRDYTPEISNDVGENPIFDYFDRMPVDLTIKARLADNAFYMQAVEAISKDVLVLDMFTVHAATLAEDVARKNEERSTRKRPPISAASVRELIRQSMEA